LSAVTAAQEERAFARPKKKMRDGERRRRFAGAADRKIAKADYRDTDASTRRPHAQGRDRSIDAGKRA
jgi:hypothetical protein